MEGMLAPAAAAVETLRAGIGALLSVDLDAVTGMEVAGAVAVVEVQVRRLGAVDARLLAVLHGRGVAGQFGAASTLELLRDRLRIPAGRAQARLAGRTTARDRRSEGTPTPAPPPGTSRPAQSTPPRDRIPSLGRLPPSERRLAAGPMPAAAPTLVTDWMPRPLGRLRGGPGSRSPPRAG